MVNLYYTTTPFQWAVNYPELLKVLTLFNRNDLSNPVKFRYRPLQSIIQEGPQCGLVALTMCLENPTIETRNDLLQRAIDCKYTCHGEMFSADDLANLAKTFLTNQWKIQLYTGELDNERIRQHLLDGDNLILVPFDIDKNNGPGIANGKKAHWAVICGAIQTKTDFYVIARHGKIQNIAIWKLKDLSYSNGQLNEIFIQNDKREAKEFKLPHGGIDGPLGLKSKAILLTYNYDLAIN